MRSKIGTKTRLAAHILALLLLIILLAHSNPAASRQSPQPQPAPPGDFIPPPAKTDAAPDAVPAAPIERIVPVGGKVDGTLDQVHVPADIEAYAPGSLRPPGETPAGPEPVEPSPEPGAVPETPAGPIDPAPPETVPEPAPQEIPAVQASIAEPAAEAEDVSEPTEPESAPPESAPSNPVEPAEPATSQPDESGSLVVAASGAGSDLPVPAATPLPGNANLVVLGDGVYWLDSRHNLEKELSAIPEIGSLVFLAPVPDYHSTGFEHVKTEVIAADLADIGGDAAEQYLQAVAGDTPPVVTAVLPGARGAAFFKGVYLLANRKQDIAEIIRELEPELEESGDARDDIIHRLMRLQGR
jgi:hypothetical protein